MIPEHMAAVWLTGYGGVERLDYRTDVPVPRPGRGQVLVNVTAAGMNNTDINTRTGWYNQNVHTGTHKDGGRAGFGVQVDGMGAWGSDIVFPRIQGADVVGRIVAVGDNVDPTRIGQRVVCDPYVRDPGDAEGLDSAGFLGADHDGGFAQFTVVPDANAVAVPAGLALSDAQLATIPCSGGTAMNMMLMAGLRVGDRVLVTGASGGVGSFLVQIAKAAGARVVAVCAAGKRDAVLALGANAVVDRAAPDLAAQAQVALGEKSFTLVVDVVGGDTFPALLSLLARGGRYVTAGAIAGPLVSLDLRTLYLKNLSFFGSTVYRRDTFAALLELLVRGAVKPAVADVQPLAQIRQAQTDFLEKHHVGSKVLQPPLLSSTTRPEIKP